MRAILRDLAARRLPRAVPRRHVRNLMRHHARHFGFVIGIQQNARYSRRRIRRAAQMR